MKATFAAAALAFSAAAFAAPFPASADPNMPTKPIHDNEVQITISILGGYCAYEQIPIDGPAKTIGKQWKGSSIDDNIDIHGTFISANSTLGADVKCALQDPTRHDIAILSEGEEIQDITGNSQKVKLTNYVVFCYTSKGDGKVPKPKAEDEEVLVTHVRIVVSNENTDQSATGLVTVGPEPLKFIDTWRGDKHLYHDGHVFATSLAITSWLDGVVCGVYNGEGHDIAMLNSGNRDEIVEFGSLDEVNVDDYSISCRQLSNL